LRADVQDARFGVPGSTARPALRSVYMGGGTPSLLPPAWIGALLERIAARFGIAAGAEVTLEANPGRGERGDLAGFRAAGVDRLSLGAQSLDASELRRLGRRHRPDDVIAAVHAARAAGFERLSLDLLYDVPGQTTDSWRDTLGGVVGLGVTHVSAYALAVDDRDDVATGTPGTATADHLPVRAGARRWRLRALPEQDADRAADQYLAADAALEAAGLTWYETSNWATAGEESRHNRVYWSGMPYEALGPGAHAYDGARTRRWNGALLDGYLRALTPPDGSPARLPPGSREVLDDATAVADRAMLALRTRDGVPAALATHPAVREVLAWGRRQGLVERDADRVTLRGRLLGSELFVRLLPTR
jgi:oxygen-independent coproporphyrinogen-3 oxidase